MADGMVRNQPVSSIALDDMSQVDEPSALARHHDHLTNVIDYKHESFAVLGLAPGDRILDVGCGTGEDVLKIAEMVAPNGRAFGLDRSTTMIEEARRRALLSGQAEIIGFFEGSAYHLPFYDGVLDAARADRLFHRLSEPRSALAEMTRVVRSGGLVSIIDPDWETLVLDVPNRALFRKIRSHFRDAHAGPSRGSHLLGQFSQMGLRDVHVAQRTFVVATDYSVANQICDFGTMADEAYANGSITTSEYDEWQESLRALQTADQIFAGIAMVGVLGIKP